LSFTVSTYLKKKDLFQIGTFIMKWQCDLVKTIGCNIEMVY